MSENSTHSPMAKSASHVGHFHSGRGSRSSLEGECGSESSVDPRNRLFSSRQILHLPRRKASEPWRLHLSSRQIIGLLGKGIEIPESGWTGEQFARQGRLLILTIARLAKLTQRRAAPYVARKANDLFRRQVDRVIERVVTHPSIRSAKRNHLIDILLPQHEQLWAQAIDDVFATAGIEAVTELIPPIQSVMGQGYSRVGILLAQEAEPDVNPRIARNAREIAQKITRINDTTRTAFNRLIRQSIEEGLTVSETAQRIREQLPKINANRSLTIARTELNNAWTQGAVTAYQQSKTLTHVSVIGCEAREPGSPTYRGESTCNIQDVPVQDAHTLQFHINHTGTIVPSRFRNEDGTVS